MNRIQITFYFYLLLSIVMTSVIGMGVLAFNPQLTSKDIAGSMLILLWITALLGILVLPGILAGIVGTAIATWRYDKCNN